MKYLNKRRRGWGKIVNDNISVKIKYCTFRILSKQISSGCKILNYFRVYYTVQA